MSVRLEIAIEKCGENDADVESRFLVREGRGGFVVPKPTARAGRVIMAKSTGHVTLETPCPDDVREVRA